VDDRKETGTEECRERTRRSGVGSFDNGEFEVELVVERVVRLDVSGRMEVVLVGIGTDKRR
jgi:hypothetical protein